MFVYQLLMLLHPQILKCLTRPEANSLDKIFLQYEFVIFSAESFSTCLNFLPQNTRINKTQGL
ncbi:MAG: hypothetical protein EBT92_15685 [Planctomycetes bacterium]|nr:hypothetical protein [Planctomycetota bacterium]